MTELNLEKPPIKDVIIGIIFAENIFSLEKIEKVYTDSLEKEYEEKKDSLIVNIIKKKLETVAKTEKIGIKISNNSKTKILFIEKNRITLTEKNCYTNGETLLRDFKEILTFFKDQLTFSKIKDFGLRYVNLINLNSVDFNKYMKNLRSNITEEVNLSNNIKAVGLKQILNLENNRTKAKIITIREKRKENIETILDIDTHYKPKIEDKNEFEKAFNELRDLKNEIFLSLIPLANEIKEFKND